MGGATGVEEAGGAESHHQIQSLSLTVIRKEWLWRENWRKTRRRSKGSIQDTQIQRYL